MTRVLLDSDVLLDLYLARELFVKEAEEIWRANEQGRFEGYVSAITPTNIYYIARKLKGNVIAKEAVRQLLATLRVCPVTDAILIAASGSPITDFEDAVQHASAVAAGIELIVTRNLVDYKAATLEVLSPADFLIRLDELDGGG